MFLSKQTSRCSAHSARLQNHGFTHKGIVSRLVYQGSDSYFGSRHWAACPCCGEPTSNNLPASIRSNYEIILILKSVFRKAACNRLFPKSSLQSWVLMFSVTASLRLLPVTSGHSESREKQPIETSFSSWPSHGKKLSNSVKNVQLGSVVDTTNRQVTCSPLMPCSLGERRLLTTLLVNTDPFISIHWLLQDSYAAQTRQAASVLWLSEKRCEDEVEYNVSPLRRSQMEHNFLPPSTPNPTPHKPTPFFYNG